MNETLEQIIAPRVIRQDEARGGCLIVSTVETCFGEFVTRVDGSRRFGRRTYTDETLAVKGHNKLLRQVKRRTK